MAGTGVGSLLSRAVGQNRPSSGSSVMRVLLASLTLSFMAVVAEAGVVVRYETKDLTTGKTSDNAVLYAQDGMLRMDSLDEQGHVTHMAIVRDGVIWNVNVPRRTYTKVDKAFV